ncbi:MAG TPA: hypothetical protein VLU43_07795, partial [Anaeromyxobacteraceae bacterium]|nr:hypothetical protein [Anaeromyxobacteraceae bacterium]
RSPQESLPAGVRPTGLSDAEKLEKSAEHLARMKAAMKLVLVRVEEARYEKDVVKLNCVNEKLAQIKGLLKVAEQADISLHEAISSSDEGADSEFAKIGIARTKVETLRGEAEQCIGQLAYVVDEKTTIEVQQPANLPGTSASEWGRSNPPSWGGAPPVVRPPPASAWR